MALTDILSNPGIIGLAMAGLSRNPQAPMQALTTLQATNEMQRQAQADEEKKLQRQATVEALREYVSGMRDIPQIDSGLYEGMPQVKSYIDMTDKLHRTRIGSLEKALQNQNLDPAVLYKMLSTVESSYDKMFQRPTELYEKHFKPIALSEGTTLIDPKTYEPIYKSNKTPKLEELKALYVIDPNHPIFANMQPEQKKLLGNMVSGDAKTEYKDYVDGRVEQLRNDPKTANMTDAQIKFIAANEYANKKLEGQKTVVQVRADTFGEYKTVPVMDTKTNSLTFMNPKEVNEANRREPGRYAQPGTVQKTLDRKALVEDIRSNINWTKQSLDNMPEFTAGQRAQLAYVLKSADPRSAWQSFTQSSMANTLTPEQTDYVTNVLQLKENAMAMRSVLGAGQGSDMMRAQIEATIPGLLNPNKAFSKMQLDKFNRTIDQLSRNFATNVQLNPLVDTTTTPPATPEVQLKDEKTLRSELSAKGITGKQQDYWIKQYRSKGIVK